MQLSAGMEGPVPDASEVGQKIQPLGLYRSKVRSLLNSNRAHCVYGAQLRWRQQLWGGLYPGDCSATSWRPGKTLMLVTRWRTWSFGPSVLA